MWKGSRSAHYIFKTEDRKATEKIQTKTDKNQTTLKEQRLSDFQVLCRSHILASQLIKTHNKWEET